MMGAEPAQVFDRDKVILVTDHNVPATTPESQDSHARMRRFAQEFQDDREALLCASAWLDQMERALRIGDEAALEEASLSADPLPWHRQ